MRIKSSAVAIRVVALVCARLDAISKMHTLMSRFDIFMVAKGSMGVFKRIGGVRPWDTNSPLVGRGTMIIGCR